MKNHTVIGECILEGGPVPPLNAAPEIAPGRREQVGRTGSPQGAFRLQLDAGFIEVGVVGKRQHRLRFSHVERRFHA